MIKEISHLKYMLQSKYVLRLDVKCKRQAKYMQSILFYGLEVLRVGSLLICVVYKIFGAVFYSNFPKILKLYYFVLSSCSLNMDHRLEVCLEQE